MKSDVIVFLFLSVFVDLFHPLFHYLPSCINSILNYEIQTCLTSIQLLYVFQKKFFPQHHFIGCMDESAARSDC